MNPIRACLLLILSCLSLSAPADPLASAQGFLDQAFPATTGAPQMKALWLTGELKSTLHEKFDYTPAQLRLRYWQQGDRTAWILDEIGKERPITIGVAVAAGQIDRVDILEYRESRGGEIQQSFFTEQFDHAVLVEKGDAPGLDRQINGITGATLSVRAVKKIATLALFLDRMVSSPQ